MAPSDQPPPASTGRDHSRFTRFWIAVLILLIVMLVIVRFFAGSPAYPVDTPLVLLLVLLTVLVLSETFDNLAFGKILSLQRTAAEAKSSASEARTEAAELRAQFAQVVASVNQNMNVVNNLAQSPSIMPASPPASEVSIEDGVAQDGGMPDEELYGLSAAQAPTAGDHIARKAIGRYVRRFGLPRNRLRYEVKLGPLGSLDPFSDSPIAFDAMLEAPERSYFFEVKRGRGNYLDGAVYRMLLQVQNFARLRQREAMLVLIGIPGSGGALWESGESGGSSGSTLRSWEQRMKRKFSKAIDRGLLQVWTFDPENPEAVESGDSL